MKNFLSKDEKVKIFNILEKSFNSKKDIRISGEFKYLQKDYQRLDVEFLILIQDFQIVYILNGTMKFYLT